VITVSAILSALLIVTTGLTLNINLLALLPLILFTAYILYLSFSNLRKPSDKLTFRIFKLASMYMAFAFLWLFVGVVITTLFF